MYPARPHYLVPWSFWRLRCGLLDANIDVDDQLIELAARVVSSDCFKLPANCSTLIRLPIISSTETVRWRSSCSSSGCPITLQSKDQSATPIRTPDTSRTPAFRLLRASPTSLRPSAFTTSHRDKLPKQAQSTSLTAPVWSGRPLRPPLRRSVPPALSPNSRSSPRLILTRFHVFVRLETKRPLDIA